MAVKCFVNKSRTFTATLVGVEEHFGRRATHLATLYERDSAIAIIDAVKDSYEELYVIAGKVSGQVRFDIVMGNIPEAYHESAIEDFLRIRN